MLGTAMTQQQVPNVRVWVKGQEYVEAAEILLDYVRIQPAAVLSALAIEIFVKSFLATRLASGHAITHRGHKIVESFELIPQNLQTKFLAASKTIDPTVNISEELEKYADVFLVARYWYEPTAPFSVGSDIVYFARHMCDSVFLFGKNREH